MNKEATDQKEKILWITSACLSSKCNRGCSHCFFDADMEGGQFFSVENAEFLAKEIKKGQRLSREVDLWSRLDLTGDGELLLNPDLVEIFDILFGRNKKIRGAIVTSGVDSKSPEEAKRLKKILSRGYASQLSFHLSFNLFEKHFPKRLTQTLKLLFENGVKKVGIKICQTRYETMKTASRLYRLIFFYFIKWIREIDPLASWEAIQDCYLDRDAEKMTNDLARLNGGCDPAKMRTLSSREIIEDMVFFQSMYDRTFRFVTKFGELEITVEPHYLTKQGRAVNLSDPGFPRNKHKRPCGFLDQYEKCYMHIGADGFYYPSCSCPNVKSLRIGHLREDSRIVYHRWLYLRKVLFGAIIKDQRLYKDSLCQFCQKVSTQLYYELRSKSLCC
jgi:MoaA/NifB/PqqE/SkfB family radical SAM enzyme